MDLLKKYHIKNSTWTHKGFHGVLHTFFPVGQTGPAMRTFFGDGCQITLFTIAHDYVDWYWNDSDLTRLRELFFKRIRSHHGYFQKIIKAWLVEQKKFDSIISYVHKSDFTKLSDKQLGALYDKFFRQYVRQFAYFMTLGDAVSMHADRYLVPEFKKVLGSDFDDIFPKLITTSHKSFVEQEVRDRKKMYSYLKKGQRIPQKLLIQHSKKYFFVQNNYAKAEYLTPEAFEKIIISDYQKTKGLDEAQKQKASRSVLLHRYKFSPWQKQLLNIMGKFFAIQDERKKYVLVSNVYQFKFLREAEKRTKIPFELLRYSIYPEYKKVLAKKIKKELFAERRKSCAVIFTPKDYKVITGKEAGKIFDYFRKSSNAKGELKGLTASSGQARGRVKIILKPHDMVNMEQDDILVASMTRPEMVPAIKLASAVVTDEGGITCHAAIVSRELGIPCVIGTKIATKVLKDGDIVEVDANKGVVRKI